MEWVGFSILDYEALKDVLGIPQPVWIIAYLCMGYVKGFADQPDLQKTGWRKRLPLEQLVHYEKWGNRCEAETVYDDAVMPLPVNNEQS